MTKKTPSWLKSLVDFGPLAVFLLTYKTSGMIPATAALLASTLVALALSLTVIRKVPLVPVVTAVVVGVFGGLTIWLQDDTFIKMKPTVIYGLFALVVGWGLLTGKQVLKAFVGEALSLDDTGWKLLSQRFLFFFLAMAVTNEVARRMLSTDMWVLWKVPGSMAATVLFMLAQAPMIQRHRQAENAEG